MGQDKTHSAWRLISVLSGLLWSWTHETWRLLNVDRDGFTDEEYKELERAVKLIDEAKEIFQWLNETIRKRMDREFLERRNKK